MPELARLRLEVRITRCVLIIAAVAFVAGAIIREPDVGTLTLRRLQLADDDGRVVGSFSLDNGEAVVQLQQDGRVCFLRPAGLSVTDNGKAAGVGTNSVYVATGDAQAALGPGVVTTSRDGSVWISPER